MPKPLISVVMPVYNAGRYLIDAVASILEQSTGDWEMICVNDGSTDASAQLLDWFALQDPRIRVIHQANQGIVSALNRGCQAAIAPLICRMDADDIALPNRLRCQLAFMRESVNCVAVGGAILQLDEDSAPLGIQRLPSDHEKIIDNLLHRRTGLFHPTTLIRSQDMKAIGGYRDQYQWVEDHDLWLRLARRGRLVNLPTVVLCYRQHANSVCWQRSQIQRARMNELLKEAYQGRGQCVPEELQLQASLGRAPAGPGKWARVAARGGHPRTAWKHLKRMWHDRGPGYYSARMTAEITLRALVGWPKRLFTESKYHIPTFAGWHARVQAANVIPEAQSRTFFKQQEAA